MSENQTRELIKRKLHRYNHLRWEAAQIAEQIGQLRATAEAPRSQAMDGLPRSSGSGDAMAGIVAELVQLEEKYMAKLHRLNVAMAEVEDMIGSLEDPVERRLMRCRYIEGMVWEEVCVEMNYSWTQTHRIHGRILDKLVEAEMGIRPEVRPASRPALCNECNGERCNNCDYGEVAE